MRPVSGRPSRKNRDRAPPLTRHLSTPGWVSYESTFATPKRNGSPRSHAPLAPSTPRSPSLAAPQPVRPPPVMTDENDEASDLQRTPEANKKSLPAIAVAASAATSAPAKVLVDLTKAGSGSLQRDSRAQLAATLAEWRKTLAVNERGPNTQEMRRASAGQVRDKPTPKLGPPMVASSKAKSPTAKQGPFGTLPAVPLTPTTPATPRMPSKPRPEPVIVEPASLAPFSLWEYLKEEVLATDFDSTQEMKWERVTNFVAVPWWVEKVGSRSAVTCEIFC